MTTPLLSSFSRSSRDDGQSNPLQACRDRQAEQMLAVGRYLTDDDLVFCDATG